MPGLVKPSVRVVTLYATSYYIYIKCAAEDKVTNSIARFFVALKKLMNIIIIIILCIYYILKATSRFIKLQKNYTNTINVNV